ncbi:MAG: hypothetical protein AMXMBFR61_26700 [Fimbriimonadales bacterium]
MTGAAVLTALFVNVLASYGQGGGGGTEATGEQERTEDRRAIGIEPIHVEVVPAFSSVEWNGNETRLFQYRSLAEGFYGDMVFLALRDARSLRSLGRGYWRDLGERDQAGFVELIPTTESHSLRFWADRFAYFPDATLDLSDSSRASSRRIWLHLAGLGVAPSFDLKAADREWEVRDIVRQRPDSGYDFRTLSYDALLSWPLLRGDVKVGWYSEGLNDRLGEVPNGWLREMTISSTQSPAPNVGASVAYTDVRTDHEGLGRSTAQIWRFDAGWAAAADLLFRAEAQFDTVDIPFTLSRYAQKTSRGGAEVSWRPSRAVYVNAGYTRHGWRREMKGSNVVQRPASDDAHISVRLRTDALGQFRLRYRNRNLINAPDSDILLSDTTATLYYDRTQTFIGSWSRSFGYLTSLYASYQWAERRNNARDYTLRFNSVNAGISTQFLPNLAGFVDFLWEDWGSNVSGEDPLNTGEDGVIGVGSAVRPWYSQGQVWTVGANLDLTERSSLDGTLTHYLSRGGERNVATYVGLEYRQEFFRDFTLGLGFQRLVSSDRLVGDFGYDANVFSITLKGTFTSGQ